MNIIYTFDDKKGNTFSMKGTINNIMAILILINLKYKCDKYFIRGSKDFDKLYESFVHDNKALITASMAPYEAWTSAFYNSTGMHLTEYIKDNVADIIGILSTARTGDAETYRLHEKYIDSIKRIWHDNNIDTFYEHELFEIDRSILISDENSEAKDAVYMCRQLADTLYTTAYLLNWNEVRGGAEVEPDKWLKKITINDVINII